MLKRFNCVASGPFAFRAGSAGLRCGQGSFCLSRPPGVSDMAAAIGPVQLASVTPSGILDEFSLLHAIERNGWNLPDEGKDSLACKIATASVQSASRIYPYVRMTPLVPTSLIGQEYGCVAYLKLESEQVTGSFKARGAVSKVTSMTTAELAAGMTTSSTGNHGLAFAYACKTVPAAVSAAGRLRVYVPSTAVEIKVQKLKSQGAEVIVHGDDCLESELEAAAVAQQEGCLYTSPYNDAQVIAAQGTVALELLAQLPAQTASELVVFVPVGGGGLIAGIAGVLKAASPLITVVGCQPEASQVMKLSVEAGEIVDVASLDTLSDGTAGGVESGAQTLQPCIDLVDKWMTASEAETAREMVAAVAKQSKLIEGSAAVAIACATHMARAGDLRGKTAVVICCGGNVALEKLQQALHLAGT